MKRYLYEQHQIPFHKINVISDGEEKPAAPNPTRDGRAPNRRVVVKVDNDERNLFASLLGRQLGVNLMFVGGCTGSAAGGPKVVRHLLMARVTLRELKRTLHPRAILPVKLGGQVVPEHTLRDVQVFMLFYLLTFSVGTATVVAFGGDLMTGITATIACLGNIGPGFETVGPMSNFASLLSSGSRRGARRGGARRRYPP